MQNKYQNVRSWLLSKERYEDVVKFDKSDKAKEMFHYEMIGKSYTDRTPTMGEKIKSKKEIEEEVYKDYHHIIKLANKSPERIKNAIMFLINIIVVCEGIIDIQNNNLYMIRKYGHPGEG